MTGTLLIPKKTTVLLKLGGSYDDRTIPNNERSCSSDADCDNTESCRGDVCAPLGACTMDDKAKHLYCIDGRYVYVECTEDSECDSGVCQNNRCKGGIAATGK